MTRLLKAAPTCGGCSWITKIHMANNISNTLRKMAAKVKTYARTEYPGMAGKKALRFIDDNFRNQSWEGIPWKPRRGGKRNAGRALLMNRGILRRGNNMEAGNGTVRIFNAVKYASVHNNGFSGQVSISAHTRRLYGKFRSSSITTRKSRLSKQQSGSTNVKSHSRFMRIPRRQFMPTTTRPSPTLERLVKRQIQLDMLKLLKSS